MVNFGKNPNTKQTTMEQIDENVKSGFKVVRTAIEDIQKKQEEELNKYKLENDTIKQDIIKSVEDWSKDITESLKKISAENKIIIEHLNDVEEMAVHRCAWKKIYRDDHLKMQEEFKGISEILYPKPKSRILVPPIDEE